MCSAVDVADGLLALCRSFFGFAFDMCLQSCAMTGRGVVQTVFLQSRLNSSQRVPAGSPCTATRLLWPGMGDTVCAHESHGASAVGTGDASMQSQKGAWFQMYV